MPKKSAIVDGEECTHLISAKITPKAFDIYAEWKRMSLGGARISMAIIATKENAENHAQMMKEIRDLQREIADYKVEIKQWMKTMGQMNASRQEAWDEVSELYAPQQARLDDFSTDQPSDDE